MTLFPLSRRTFLRGAGGVAIGLPLLEAMLPRRASAAEPPRRFVFFYFSNGVNPSTWAPTGTTTQFTLSPALKPLEALQDKLVVLSGVDMVTARNNGGNGHNVGMTNLLTARKFVLEKQTQFGAIGWGAGITIDQQIAAKIGGTTKFGSLQFGVQSFRSYGANAYSYISYAGSQKPIPSEDDPRKMFNRLFTDVGAAPADQQTRLDKRKSVLDFVAEDFRQLNARLGAEDRAKIDAHLTGVRDIESRLTLKGQAGASCRRPTVELPTNYNSNDFYPQTGKAQMDLLAMALACDLTRVATLQWSSAQSGVNHTKWAAPQAGPGYHHGISHQTDQASMESLLRIQQWYMGQLAYLGTQLKSFAESNGTVLDNSVVLAGSEVGVGQSHTFKDMPWAMLGGAGGSIKTNRWLKYAGAAHNDLYVSLQNAMGITATTFGDPTYCKGALPGLVG